MVRFLKVGVRFQRVMFVWVRRVVQKERLRGEGARFLRGRKFIKSLVWMSSEGSLEGNVGWQRGKVSKEGKGPKW